MFTPRIKEKEKEKERERETREEFPATIDYDELAKRIVAATKPPEPSAAQVAEDFLKKLNEQQKEHEAKYAERQKEYQKEYETRAKGIVDETMKQFTSILEQKEKEKAEKFAKIEQERLEKEKELKAKLEKEKEKEKIEEPKIKPLLLDKVTKSVPCPDCDSLLVHLPKDPEKRAICPGCGTAIDIESGCCPICGCNYGFKRPRIDKNFFGKKKSK